MDIGYACSTKLGAPLLYGNSTRQAPCVVQTEGVQWVVRVFFMFLPGICYLLCCIPLKYMRIGPKEHAAIVAGTVARYKGGKVKDPLSNEMVEAISSVDRTIALEHFSEWEQRKASEFGLSFLYKGEEYVGAALLVGICSAQSTQCSSRLTCTYIIWSLHTLLVEPDTDNRTEHHPLRISTQPRAGNWPSGSPCSSRRSWSWLRPPRRSASPSALLPAVRCSFSSPGRCSASGTWKRRRGREYVEENIIGVFVN